MRGVDEGDVFTAEQTLHFAHFELALGIAGIAAIGLALVADSGEAIRIDGQAEQLFAVFFQLIRKLQALHVVFGQRIVGGANTVLHGHIQAGGRFAAA